MILVGMGLFVAAGSASLAVADSASCQRDFQNEARACKAAFDSCHCQACPDSRLCGGNRPPNQCHVNHCIEAQRQCRARAEQARKACLKR